MFGRRDFHHGHGHLPTDPESGFIVPKGSNAAKYVHHGFFSTIDAVESASSKHVRHGPSGEGVDVQPQHSSLISRSRRAPNDRDLQALIAGLCDELV